MNVCMAQTELRQIYRKLSEIDSKVSALLLNEEKPTRAETLAIKRGEKEFSEGKFAAWGKVKSKYK